MRVTLSADIAEAPERSLDLLALDEALIQLGALSPRQARVVEMRYFAGLEIEEIADALDVAPATVKRDWTFARLGDGEKRSWRDDRLLATGSS